MALLDYYRRRPRVPVVPGVDSDHWGTNFGRGWQGTPESPAVLPAESVYARPRRAEVLPPAAAPVPYTLEPSAVAASPTVYSRPRTVEEPADELTKIAETRAYHAGQKVTNDDPWYVNFFKNGLMALGGAPARSGGELLGRFLGGAGAGVAMPDFDDRMEQRGELANLDERYAREYGRQKDALGLEALGADVEYKRRRPDLEAEKIATRGREAARRNLVTLYNRLPEFDPTAPENADLADQMRAEGLPVVPKQASQQLRMVQDAATGGWSVIAAPKTGGQATASSVTTADGKPLVTTSAAQVASRIAENNLKYRKEKDVADRAQRQAMHNDRMKQANATLAERVKARVSQEAARALAAGQRAKAIKITEAKARIWAKNEGADWETFVDALDDADVQIVDK